MTHLAPELVRLIGRCEMPRRGAEREQALLRLFHRDVFGRMLEKFLRQARAFGPGSQVEAIHDVRVLARRVDEYLEILAPLAPASLVLAGKDYLQRFMRALSPVRNSDVSRGLLQETLKRDLSALERDALLHVDRRLGKRRRKRLEAAVAVAGREDSRERLALLAQLRRSLARADRAQRLRFADVLAGHLHRRAGEALEHLRREAALSTDKDLHALRIALRRLRYSAEACRKILRAPGAADVARVRRFLRILGTHHDLAVLVARVGKESARLDVRDPETERLKAGMRRLAKRFAARRDSKIRAFHRLASPSPRRGEGKGEGLER